MNRHFRAAFRAWIVTALIGVGISAQSAEPQLSKLDLFTSGQGGYALYRIPGLVITSKGTLLAYCEARKSTRSDWGTIDIMLRRSVDGGQTWSDPKVLPQAPGPYQKNPVALAQKLGETTDVTWNNPVAIVDRQTGAVHFLYCLEYMRCFYLRSDDDGVSCTKPVEITTAFESLRPQYGWKVLATGPGHGIQLKSGRLLVPVWLSTGTGGHAHRPSVVTTVFSDDHGATWHMGDIAASETNPLINPNETTAVELADGRVLLNMRSESPEHRRAVTTSGNGAGPWSPPQFDDALVEPICMASIQRLNLPDQGEPGRILFSHPDNLERADGKLAPGKSRDRKNLTIRVSEDEGRTWKFSRPLESGPSAYSDLAVTPDRTIFCLYERTSPTGPEKVLTLAKFNLDWIENGK